MIRGAQVKLDSKTQIFRGLFHLASGTVAVVCFLTLFDTRTSASWVILGILGVLGFFELLRLRVPTLNDFFLGIYSRVLKPDEKSELSGQFFYCLGLVWAFVFLPKVLAVQAVLILAWTDPLAGISGARWGKLKWVDVFQRFWSLGLTDIEKKIVGSKTVLGSFVGFFAAFFLGLLCWWYWVPPFEGLIGGQGPLANWNLDQVGLLFAFLGAWIAMVAEAWPSQWDDNINIPFWVGSTLWVVSLFLGIPLPW